MRHVDGWGVHTFRLVTDEGNSTLVKFRWKTLQGRAGLVWEEAQALGGKNPDFHRQDLWDAIESGRYPEWEVRYDSPESLVLTALLCSVGCSFRLFLYLQPKTDFIYVLLI